MREHYTNMERLERLKKERRDYVRGKYDKLFREYSCEQLGAKEARLNLEGGIAAFKNLARKEEEFAEQTGDFRRKLGLSQARTSSAASRPGSPTPWSTTSSRTPSGSTPTRPAWSGAPTSSTKRPSPPN
jgi:hypothetical protein